MENEEYTTMKSNVSVQKQDDATKQNASEQNRSSLSQQATQTKDAVKNAASDVAANVKQQARQAASEVGQAVSEITTDAKETAKQTANDVVGEMRTRASSLVDERKNQAADRLHGFADALRETGNTLHGRQEDAIADYATVAADQIEKFSGYLRQQDIGNLLQEVQSFARRQPELFVAGTLAVGFLLGRFFKSSGSQSQWNQGYGQNYGQGYSQSSGMYGSQPYNQYGQAVSPYGSQYSGGQYSGSNTGSGQYGASEYQRQYGASGYSGGSGTGNYQPYSSSGSSGQYGASGYQGQRGLSEEQYTRQGQTDWANSSGTPGQMASATGEMNDTLDQTDDASGTVGGAMGQTTGQNKADRSSAGQSSPSQSGSSQSRSGQSQSNQQKSEQNKADSSQTGNAGRKEG